jgi:hypothetical protein
MKKLRTKKVATPVQEESPRAKTFDPINFPRAYVPLRNPTTKQVTLQKEAKYDLVTSVIPPGVTVEGDMLGTVGSLRILDQNPANLKKFPELPPHNYLCTSINPDSLVLRFELQE